MKQALDAAMHSVQLRRRPIATSVFTIRCRITTNVSKTTLLK